MSICNSAELSRRICGSARSYSATAVNLARGAAVHPCVSDRAIETLLLRLLVFLLLVVT
jgi:hypothetical protein